MIGLKCLQVLNLLSNCKKIQFTKNKMLIKNYIKVFYVHTYIFVLMKKYNQLIYFIFDLSMLHVNFSQGCLCL